MIDNWRWWEDDYGNVEGDEEVIVLVLKWQRLLGFWKWKDDHGLVDVVLIVMMLRVKVIGWWSDDGSGDVA